MGLALAVARLAPGLEARGSISPSVSRTATRRTSWLLGRDTGSSPGTNRAFSRDPDSNLFEISEYRP
jgi:hypothetical protein